MNLSLRSAALAVALLSFPASAGTRPDRRALEQAFEARYGPGWTFEWDGATGTPSAIYGPGVAVAPAGGMTEAQALEVGAALLEANRDLLGAGPESFVPVINRRARNV